MKEISIGKYRGLQRIASERGTITTLALDHRQNLRKSNPEFMDDQKLSEFKIEVASILNREATSVLLDPEVSAAQAIAKGAILRQTGLVIALESTGYTGDAHARHAQIIPGWSVAKAKQMGADAVKLLVYYHPKSSTANEVEEFVRRIAQECQASDVALMLEPLSYSLDEKAKLSSAEKRFVVVETARRLSPLGIDLLKAEFPLAVDDPDSSNWQSACAEISAACVTPWILLSAAVDFETYLRQVDVACQSGASGIAVGRAVWQEAVGMQPQNRPAFLNGVACERLARLNALCTALAKPYMDFYSSSAPLDWYKGYSTP
jgi:tagatose-1,6-bisphosphate aldolase